MVRLPLEDILVVELGGRIGVGGAGGLLAELGADVVLVETAVDCGHKWRHRTGFAAGKRSLRVDPAADGGLLDEVLRRADVILASSDDGGPLAGVTTSGPSSVRVDLTAFGAGRDAAGASDGEIQAMTGIMETTGLADGPPVPIGAPALEFSASLYIAAAVLSALRVRRRDGPAQDVEVALFDVAINALPTFLPAYFGGGRIGRLGNAHSLTAPWNGYECADGWILMCCPSQAQWLRLCPAMGALELVDEPGFEDVPSRVRNRERLDARIGAWAASVSIAEALDALKTASIPGGPIVTMAEMADEANIRHREMVREVVDGATGARNRVPGPMLRASGWRLRAAKTVPAPDEARAWLGDAILAGEIAVAGEGATDLPLAGLRVLEIGQYTTAPLAGRHLAALGAEVLKIEPTGGDPGRTWAPHQDGLSYYFAFSNSGKTALALDINTDAGAEDFRLLLAGADILLENLKPGALAKLGFDAEALLRINPRLIYCAISGFGAESAYPGRPAVDTIVQSMSGFMDLTRDGETPLKSGVSMGDIAGGQLGLVAILAALEQREVTGAGQVVDIAMQDIALWMTQTAWNAEDAATPARHVFACAEGYVYAEGDGTPSDVSTLPAAEAVSVLRGGGFRAQPVVGIWEAAEHPLVAARDLLPMTNNVAGRPWPSLGSPMRLSLTPPRVLPPIGEARPLDGELRHRLGLHLAAE